MEEINVVLTMVLGLLLRLGIPIGFTIGLVYFLKRLDEHWQREAQMQNTKVNASNPACWKINGCSEEKKKHCSAYANPTTPCWQVFRRGGNLQEKCLMCRVFKEAPIPVNT